MGDSPDTRRILAGHAPDTRRTHTVNNFEAPGSASSPVFPSPGRPGSVLAAKAAGVKFLNHRHLRRTLLCKCRDRRWLRDQPRVLAGKGVMDNCPAPCPES